MKEFKSFIVPFLCCLLFFLIGIAVGFQAGKEEYEHYPDHREIDSLKSIINDNEKVAKLDTIFIQGTHTIDTIKIYYKIKQNEAKNDTSATTIISKFEYLLSKNRNRADKRSK